MCSVWCLSTSPPQATVFFSSSLCPPLLTLPYLFLNKVYFFIYSLNVLFVVCCCLFVCCCWCPPLVHLTCSLSLQPGTTSSSGSLAAASHHLIPCCKVIPLNGLATRLIACVLSLDRNWTQPPYPFFTLLQYTYQSLTFFIYYYHYYYSISLASNFFLIHHQSSVCLSVYFVLFLF